MRWMQLEETERNEAKSFESSACIPSDDISWMIYSFVSSAVASVIGSVWRLGALKSPGASNVLTGSRMRH